MISFSYSHTAAGAARIARERQRAAMPAIPDPEPEQPPAVEPEPVPEPCKVIQMIPRTEVQQIIADVAHQHGLTYADILGRENQKRWAPARFDAIAAVRRARPWLSLTQIGRIFGGRDHTCVLNALRKRGLA